MYQAGEKRWGTDENVFNMVLASQSYEQLRAVFDAYGKISGKDIEHAIKSEMSGDLSSGMLTIGEHHRQRQMVVLLKCSESYFTWDMYRDCHEMFT